MSSSTKSAATAKSAPAATPARVHRRSAFASGRTSSRRRPLDAGGGGASSYCIAYEARASSSCCIAAAIAASLIDSSRIGAGGRDRDASAYDALGSPYGYEPASASRQNEPVDELPRE